MKSFAHIINPFRVEESDPFFQAQQLTIETLRIANKKDSLNYSIEILFAAYQEDQSWLPNDFGSFIKLEHSSNEFIPYGQLKLPLIGEIIELALDNSKAEYIIYSNVDISLYPNFYDRVFQLIQEGNESLIINRRNIPNGNYKTPDLAQVYKLETKCHPGFDCFVVHRDLLKRFNFDQIFIGVPFIGISFAHQIFAFAAQYCLVEGENLTFHIGEEWYANRAPKNYYRHNQKAFWRIVENGLLDHHHLKKLPFQDSIFPLRLLKWCLQPSIPVRLIWKLAMRGRF